MAFLIDVTEDRFKTPANRDVIEYIRRDSPFAHSDIGDKLIRLARQTSGAHYYCPDFSACAYVVLHTKANVIFAIALEMLKIDFRLSRAAVSEAVDRAEGEHSDIGTDWLSIRPFPKGESRDVVDARLTHWCGAACRHAQQLKGDA